MNLGIIIPIYIIDTVSKYIPTLTVADCTRELLSQTGALHVFIFIHTYRGGLLCDCVRGNLDLWVIFLVILEH